MSTKQAILGIISFGPASGYTIKTEMEKGGISWIWDLSYGSIYPGLETLASEGLITLTESRTEGRERKVFELTRAGWEALERWLKDRSAFPMPLRDELLLKMLFWGTVSPDDRATLIGHLRSRAAMTQDLLDGIDSSNSEAGASDEYHGLLLDYAKTRLVADLTWLKRSIALLEGPAQPPSHDPAGIFARARERKERASRSSG